MIHARLVKDHDEIRDGRHVRRLIFVHEQGIPERVVMDEIDVTCNHFIAFNHEGDIIGTARSYPIDILTMKIERVGVLAEWRGNDIGRILMEAVEKHARVAGYRTARLFAQTPAIPFYDAIGYQPFGKPFEEAGILHVAMEKRLMD